MDRVGFKAIDFTTSTHMGVAVRYKKEDPWERIRLMAPATPNTPLQFMSTGFRFISWETASPEFMALAFRTLCKNGMRRFCLADPMNDADANVACARMVKQAGGEYVIAALVFTLSPIHDDAHYVARARTLAASPDIDALYIKDPGGLLTPLRARTLIPAVIAGNRRQAARAALPLHHRSRRAHLHGRAGVRRQRPAVRLGRRCGWHSRTRRRSAWLPICARSDIRSTSTMRRLPKSAAISRGSRRPKAFPPAGRRLRCGLSAASIAGWHGRHDAPASGREPRVAPGRRGDRGTGPRARGTRLADRDDSVRADPDDAGGHECHRQGTLQR